MKVLLKYTNITSFNFNILELIQLDSKIILKGGEIIIKSFKKKVYFNISPQKEIYIDDREGNYIKIDSEGRILEHGNNKAFFDSGDKSVGIQTLENNIVVTGICSQN